MQIYFVVVTAKEIIRTLSDIDKKETSLKVKGFIT